MNSISIKISRNITYINFVFEEAVYKNHYKHEKRLNKAALRTHRKHEAISTHLRKQDSNQRYGFYIKDKRRRKDRR